GETFVMKMPACKITDLIEVLKSVFGQTNLPVKEIGMREGEKLHEVLISRTESQTTYQYDKQYYVILPSHSAEKLLNQYNHLNKISFPYFQSDQELMPHEEIKLLLQKGKFI
ncbi:polysaccharide biosynthesis protein, partial [Paenibacillus sp. MCAF20]